MASLGDLMRKQHGIDAKNVKNETKEKELAAYWKKVKEYDKKEPVRPKARTIFENLPVFQEGFKVDEFNSDFVSQLCHYFAKDENFKNFKTLNRADLNKGVLLVGNCGLGKSYTIDAIYKMFQKVNGFSFGYVSSLYVVDKFNQSGDAGIMKYKEREWYFDDFGTEELGSHYGKNEVLKALLEHRYNKFVSEGLKTHMSTNLTPEMIKERYGERIYSRMQQMFNIIILTGKDRRK